METPQNPRLTLDRIFASDEFNEEALGTFLWSKRRGGYFRLINSTITGAGNGTDLVWFDTATDQQQIIVPAHAFIPPGETRPLSLDQLTFSEDESKLLIYTNTKRVWRQNTRGDYWVMDIATRELRKLGGDTPASTLQFAKFSPDGSRVAYVQKNNIYVQEVRNLKITPLTHDGSETIINGTADWAYEEELNLRDGFRWSPNGKHIAFWQLDCEGVGIFYLINNTDGIYSKPIPIPYPKVGEQNSAARLGIVEVTGENDPLWLDIPGDPRNHYPAQMEWHPDGRRLLVQQFNRLQNTNRVFLADASTGEATQIHVEREETWLENENPVSWANDGENYIWLSEHNNWRNAYLMPLSDAGETFGTRITPAEFDLIRIDGLNDKTGSLYYGASPDDPTHRYLYRSSFSLTSPPTPLLKERGEREGASSGNSHERITPADQPGWHTYNISPNGDYALHTYSRFDVPPTVELIRLPDHTRVRSLIENERVRMNFEALQKPGVEFLRLDIGVGAELDAWCITPPDFDAEKKYPVLFYVYGEPHGATVRDGWNSKTGLWYRMLAQEGYIVVSVDNRGTPAPRGRAWRKIVYRQIGQLSADDQAAAVREFLRTHPYADPVRVGIWGYSGGGSSSLHAIFRFPDVYKMAMAVASVPNQRLYNSIYQERYMGLPEDNTEGYRLGSPLTYASGLQGDLLIVHGTGDDNCHYQGVEMLLNELIAHNKPFTVMPYPNRTHALSEGANTTRHFYSLLTRYLHEHLPLDSAN